MRVKILRAIGVLAPLLLVAALGAHAEGRGRPYVQGVANLDFEIQGQQVLVRLFAPAATLVGFEHSPSTRLESETLTLARENLEAGDGMVRFNTKAACRLVEASVDADLPDSARPGKAGSEAPARVEISAEYGFACARPEALDTAALGLFIGFPALQRVLVHYVMPAGRGAAELTPGNPVVSFVPL
ncbi:ZrgA family zinc uptake protein [Thiorhodococcus minor]|uniref:DUF2796 domain-containing protein n=1 Tax=Thiorhodococcus minor TaxID=57489 RepID=A0A6M0K0X4_9GAMM|nr:DUF2796 domain-containing protein [Thiorhodococcus minor]NEV63418.1 DUF2796 domain-containing protein [Thiorhodococcus minor]